jgi:hypothetical protein
LRAQTAPPDLSPRCGEVLVAGYFFEEARSQELLSQREPRRCEQARLECPRVPGMPLRCASPVITTDSVPLRSTRPMSSIDPHIGAACTSKKEPRSASLPQQTLAIIHQDCQPINWWSPSLTLPEERLRSASLASWLPPGAMVARLAISHRGKSREAARSNGWRAVLLSPGTPVAGCYHPLAVPLAGRALNLAAARS